MANKIYVGIRGWVVCVRAQDGKEVWRQKLRGGANITTIMVEDDVVYAMSNGYLSALNSSTGRVRWRNDLKRLGHGIGVLSSSASESNAVAQMAQVAQVAATVAVAAAAGVIVASGAS